MFRFCTEVGLFLNCILDTLFAFFIYQNNCFVHIDYKQYTIEEKVIERAYKKLALDALVIQQGRLAEQKSEWFPLVIKSS